MSALLLTNPLAFIASYMAWRINIFTGMLYQDTASVTPGPSGGGTFTFVDATAFSYADGSNNDFIS